MSEFKICFTLFGSNYKLVATENTNLKNAVEIAFMIDIFNLLYFKVGRREKVKGRMCKRRKTEHEGSQLFAVESATGGTYRSRRKHPTPCHVTSYSGYYNAQQCTFQIIQSGSNKTRY